MSELISGDGTPEDVWRAWLPEQDWPAVDVAGLLDGAEHAVVLAAHPDDEVLGVGGLLAGLAAADVRLDIVWASDGEGSHPGSTAPLVTRLAQLRRQESATALDRLGVRGYGAHYVGLPDGSVAEHEDELGPRLDDLIRPGSLVLALWRGDGHPDHEACGRAAASAAAAGGGRLVEYPVWAWHWGAPGDPRVPWQRARRLALSPELITRKATAVDAFDTQVRPIGPDRWDGPVLSAQMLAHFARDVEVVFV